MAASFSCSVHGTRDALSLDDETKPEPATLNPGWTRRSVGGQVGRERPPLNSSTSVEFIASVFAGLEFILTI
jgi:hypothetical protein